MKKALILGIISLFFSISNSFSQEKEQSIPIPNIETKEYLSELLKQHLLEWEDSSYHNYYKGTQFDTSAITDYKVFYYTKDQKKYAIAVFALLRSGGHFDNTETNILEFEKGKSSGWVNTRISLRVTGLSQWESPPKYKFLKLSNDDYGVLVAVNMYGSHGYFKYEAELFSLATGKVFQISTDEDNCGALSAKECLELQKDIFTKKMPNGQYYLCVSTKGHIAKMKKVNYVDYFKFEEEHNFFMKVKREHLK